MPALVQVHLVVEGRRRGGLAEVDGAILDVEDAVGSGTGGGGENAAPCASAYVHPCAGHASREPVRHDRHAEVTGMQERVKPIVDGAKGEVTIGTYGCACVGVP